MNFQRTFFIVIIFGMIITASTYMINERAEKYGSDVVSDLTNDYSKINELSDTAEEKKGNINPQSGEASSDPESKSYEGAYGIITNLFVPFEVIPNMINAVGERFNIPDWILISLTTLFLFSMVLGIVAIIFRRATSTV